jgi:AraC-like DNA-binding protein
MGNPFEAELGFAQRLSIAFQPMPRIDRQRLEQSCAGQADGWVKLAPYQAGFQRLEAFFAGHGFDPHRHDTYVVGLTLGGVQSFAYRGAQCHSRSGEMVVLHPDELHDGHAGTPSGFRYRAIYIEPRLIHQALAERGALPFVASAVTADRRLGSCVTAALQDLDSPLDDIELDELVAEIAAGLARLDRSAQRRTASPRCSAAVAKAREFIDEAPIHTISSADLEAVSGLSRFSLARHFRVCLGTSPHRYLTMRRLERARGRMLDGNSLAETALECGFADQSHMTRHFKRAYGMSPAKWLTYIGSSPP